MNLDQIDETVLRMPKVELHVHLEGATDAETVWTMAERNGMPLPGNSLERWKEHYEFKSFNHFIEVYETASTVMKTLDDWKFMVERFLANQSRQNIVYSEVFLSASYQVGKLPLDEWVAAIAEGATIGEQRYDVQARFIPDISRHFPETQQAVLECALEATKTGTFIGLGLGGIETGYPASLFRETYHEARRRGLRVVAHAGETTGPRTIWDAIQILQAERIGHGIRCLDDPALVAELRELQLPLEVCPTSNYCLGVVSRDEPHPLRQMVDAGLCCTVNSDDPPMFGTTLVEEFRRLARQGFSLDELRRLNLNAVESCFLPPEEKHALRVKVEGTDDQ